MLEPRSDPATFKWRRTAFTRIDGAVEVAEDDWSLTIDGLQAARIYRVRAQPSPHFSSQVFCNLRCKFGLRNTR
jgi:hypothetical protein